MKSTLEFFSNDRYKALKLLFENQVKIKDDIYVSLSQQEIADMLHFSKFKTNKIIHELIDNDYVLFFNGKRGKYAITNKGYKVFEQ